MVRRYLPDRQVRIKQMASLTDFLNTNILTSNTELSAITSGALSIIDGIINTSDLSLANTLADFVAGGDQAITNLILTYDQLNTLESDQSTTATLYDPVLVPITSNSESVTFARSDPTKVIEPATTQPNSIAITPTGTEPPTAYRGQYPYVHTEQSESGHIREVDDTPGHERLFEYHKAGTYTEIAPDGRRVLKVVGDNYSIVAMNDHVYIEGSSDVYIRGNMHVTCLNDVKLDVGGRLEMNVNEDIRMKGKSISFETTSGDINIYSAANTNMRSTTGLNIFSDKNIALKSTENMDLLAIKKLAIGSTEDMNILSMASLAMQSKDEMNLTGGKIFMESFDTFNQYASGKMSLFTGSDMNLKAGGSWITSAGSRGSIKAGSILSMDGSAFLTQKKLSLDAATAAGTIDAIDAASATDSKKTGLATAINRESTTVPSIAESIVQGLDDDPDASAAAIKEAVASGRITQEEADALEKEAEATGTEDTSPAANINPIAKTATDITSLPDTSISPSLQLSARYRLADLTSPGPIFKYQLIAQNGRSKATLAGNLALLARNCIEPIATKYGPIRINSAFRQQTGKSQHAKGMATDITYGSRSTDPQTMYEIAIWIKNHVAFDQLILEYGNSQIWTHISFNAEGTQRGQVLTCPNPSSSGPVYKPGLLLLKWGR